MMHPCWMWHLHRICIQCCYKGYSLLILESSHQQVDERMFRREIMSVRGSLSESCMFEYCALSNQQLFLPLKKYFLLSQSNVSLIILSIQKLVLFSHLIVKYLSLTFLYYLLFFLKFTPPIFKKKKKLEVTPYRSEAFILGYRE